MKHWYAMKKPAVDDPDNTARYGVFHVEETTIRLLKTGVRYLGPFKTEAAAEAAVLKGNPPKIAP